MVATTSGKKPVKTSTNAAKEEKKVPPAKTRKSPAAVKTTQSTREDEKSGKRMKQDKTEKKTEKTAIAAKPKKSKLLRDSYSIPENGRHEIAMLKKRCIENGREVKKSYLLRAGIHVLGQMDDSELLAAVGRIK